MTTRHAVPLRPRRRNMEEREPPRPLHAGDLIEDVDELLDEIDAVLEEAAVLVNFRQRGGQ